MGRVDVLVLKSPGVELGVVVLLIGSPLGATGGEFVGMLSLEGKVIPFCFPI